MRRSLYEVGQFVSCHSCFSFIYPDPFDGGRVVVDAVDHLIASLLSCDSVRCVDGGAIDATVLIEVCERCWLNCPSCLHVCFSVLF